MGYTHASRLSAVHGTRGWVAWISGSVPRLAPTYIVMAYTVMAYVVMAYTSYGLYWARTDLYSYGLYSYDLYSYGLNSHGLYKARPI